jgi:hypothetical protein
MTKSQNLGKRKRAAVPAARAKKSRLETASSRRDALRDRRKITRGADSLALEDEEDEEDEEEEEQEEEEKEEAQEEDAAAAADDDDDDATLVAAARPPSAKKIDSEKLPVLLSLVSERSNSPH